MLLNKFIINLIIEIKKHTFLSSVNELSGVHAFDGNEMFNSLLVSVCVSEDDLGKWGSSS